MLSRPCFSNDPSLPHAAGDQNLSDSVIDLMGACMAQILPLQINFRSSEVSRETLGEIERRWPADKICQVVSQFFLKDRIVLQLGILRRQFHGGRHQGFRNISPSINAKMTG